MLSLQLEITVFMVVTVFLGYSRAILCHRNARSWEELVTRLHPAWAVNALGKATSIQHTRSLFYGAGTVLEMVDYAERNSDGVDPALLADLRRGALQIRISAAREMTRAAFSRSAK